jgi:hypothetical protein
MELKLIHRGITAEAGSIQATRYGVIFSAVDIDEVNTYMLPLVTEEIKKIPKLTEHYKPVFDNIGNDTYTITFHSSIIQGDSYLLSATWMTSGAPIANGLCYVCQPYLDKDGRWHGRWARWTEDQTTEYQVDSSPKVISHKPTTMGYYEFKGKLFKVYLTEYAKGTEYFNYYIASYGWHAGSEAPVDKVYMVNEDGTLVTYDKSFYITLESGWVGKTFIDSMTITNLWFRQKVTNGDMDLSIYSDFGSTADHTETFESLSDVAGSEKFVDSFEDAPIDCSYFKVKQVFKEVETVSPPNSDEEVLFNDIFYDFEVKTSKGKVDEASF